MSISRKKSVATLPVNAPANPAPRVAPRLLRITDAAAYLSCTFSFVETLYREGTIPTIVLGKRRLFCKEDLDAFIDHTKEEQNAARSIGAAA